MYSHFHGRNFTAVLVTSLALLTAACGNQSVGGIGGGNFNTSQLQTANRFAGRYLGSGALSGGQQGDLSITVAESGQVDGTLVVKTAALRPATEFVIPTGDYIVSGSVDPTTGAFRMSGVLPGFGTFQISGLVPSGTGLGNYQLIINGQVFTGLIQNASLGTPTPGGVNAGNSRLIVNGTLSNFVFTGAGGYNGANPPVTVASLIGGVVVTGSANNNQATLSISQLGAGTQIRSLAFGAITHGNPLTVGQSYPLVTTLNGDGSFVSLSETTGLNIDKAWTVIPGTTGSVTVTSLSSTAVEMDFQFSNVGPNSEAVTSTAAGTFSTSGHVLGNFAPAL